MEIPKFKTDKELLTFAYKHRDIGTLKDSDKYFVKTGLTLDLPKESFVYLMECINIQMGLFDCGGNIDHEFIEELHRQGWRYVGNQDFKNENPVQEDTPGQISLL